MVDSGNIITAPTGLRRLAHATCFYLFQEHPRIIKNGLFPLANHEYEQLRPPPERPDRPGRGEYGPHRQGHASVYDELPEAGELASRPRRDIVRR